MPGLITGVRGSQFTYPESEWNTEDNRDMMEAIIADNLCPRIICESDGTMAEDALAMKKYWTERRGE